MASSHVTIGRSGYTIMTNIAPYGTWNSPITTKWVTLGQKKFTNIVIDGDDIYWDEMRPNEDGRTAIVKQGKDVIEAPFNARTRVYEYGGGAFTVSKGIVYFVNYKDQRIYVGQNPLTEPGVRFGGLKVFGNLLYAVGEKGKENFIAAIDLTTGKYEKVASGRDFYSSPTPSPDGKKLAFLALDYPNMPWDAAELWVRDSSGALQHIAGGNNESIFQPEWSSDGSLFFVSDRTGWWNLYRENKPIYPMDAEFGLPQWVQSLSTYDFAGDQILAAYVRLGTWSLALLPSLKNPSLQGTYYSQIRTGKGFAAFIMGSPTESNAVVRLDLSTMKLDVLAHNLKPHIDPSNFSVPQFLSYPSKNGRTAHGFYYPPANQEYRGPDGEKPPLLVITHGGPTSATLPVFDLKIQYWTSRGFAVLDVDYAGSTGYGRPYRDSLKKQWGIDDVEDCEAGAQYCIDKGWVDPKKIAIDGRSAGGYTTLCALTFGKIFTVGASYYGVSDLAALAAETHKFESHYLEQLVGEENYRARSPLFSPEMLHCPIIFFQGLEDKIVPPNQAQLMHAALKKRGILTELVLYEGEQHGFRRAENIRDCLEKELAFYLKVWGIKR